MSPRQLMRLLQIAAVARRYRLDDLLGARRSGPLGVLVRLLPVRRVAAGEPLSRRTRLALQALGPIFVKFGQLLSTRRDLLPAPIADELARLREEVDAFPGEAAAVIVAEDLGAPVEVTFAAFEARPLASASIAQVHAAVLHDGREVVVKVLRPGVRERIATDIALLRAIAGLVDRHHPRARRIRPLDIVAQIESTLEAELDFRREGANASLLRRNWSHSNELYVPEVHWSHSGERVLTLERVRGIGADDLLALDAAGVDRPRIAESFVRLFYTQVFRDNFFHADAHAGNIWVEPAAGPGTQDRLVALDFGIMGQLTPRDQYYLAENFMAMFRRDYRRIAELHVDAGWVPAEVRLDELEASVRAVCEPYFTRPLAEVPLAEVVFKLFRTAQRYELTLQPQLILLQKTLFNIEGVGRLLDPRLDIWAVAHPVLERILRERYSLRRLASEFRRRLPELLSDAPDMPRRVRTWLDAGTSASVAQVRRGDALVEAIDAVHDIQRRTVLAVAGGGLLVAAAVLHGLEAPGPRLWGAAALTWLAAIAGAGLLLAALRRRVDRIRGI